jgi:hypothetical protein
MPTNVPDGPLLPSYHVPYGFPEAAAVVNDPPLRKPLLA